MPNKYSIEREITINQPKDRVFKYIKSLQNQNNFSVWSQIDPMMKKTFTGTDGTIGAITAWESNNENVGVGEQEIKNIIEGHRIDFELRFKTPFESTANAFMSTTAITPNKTNVIWNFNGSMDYPMNLMLPIIQMDKVIGKDLETGLTNLKVILEK